MNASPRSNARAHGEPYCSNCGYELTGAIDSSRCPECGKPLVDVLTRPGLQVSGGRRFLSRATVMGMPLVHIAFGPQGTERIGRARGFIAIGDEARGVIAIGGRALGIVSIGGLSAGGISLGGCSVGLVGSLGGCSIGGIAIGGMAAGGLAQGGFAAGVVAQGGMAIGWIARGGQAIAPHVGDELANNTFRALRFIFGATPGTIAAAFPIGLGVFVLIAGSIALAGWIASRRPGETFGPGLE